MDFSAVNQGLWEPVIQLGLLSVVLFLANLFQRKISLIRQSLLPVAVLGGFIAFLFKTVGVIKIDTAFMEAVTYHTIALGFIALGLRIPKRCETAASKSDGIKSGALIVSTYLLQGLIGLVISIFLGYTFMPDLFKAAGVLLPMGYGQGPGQANNIGTTYELVYGFHGGSSFGLALASMGFLWACIGGVIYMNILVRKNRLIPAKDKDNSTLNSPGLFEDEGEVPMSRSIDRLTIQGGLVLFIYFVTYLVSLGLTTGISQIPFLSGSAKMLSSLVWGFNFVIGSLIALLTRNLFFLLRKKKLMTRQYPNNYLLNRISGMLFDVMIAAGICTIEIKELSGLLLPFILISTAGGFATLFYLRWICRRLYRAYPNEGFFAMYGMLTGTVSTGILLLREVDPGFSSPATNNLVSGTSYAILFGIPMLVLIGLAPQSDTMLFWVVGLIIAYGLLLFWLMMRKTNRSG